MLAIIIRSIFVMACSIIGYLAINTFYNFPLSLTGFIIGAGIAVIILTIDVILRKIPLAILAGALLGLAIGLCTSYLLIMWLESITLTGPNSEILFRYVNVSLVLALGFVGLSVGASKGMEAVHHGGPVTNHAGEVASGKILDTSVIIDGRFADICDTGFIEGTLTVPRFVLDELQLIADSSDSIKRSRGRRGLEVLNRMKNSSGITIEISDTDFPKLKGVDAKLVALAKKRDGIVVTNDYNLNKVAELQGIRVLNVNDLANALKPLVLPGETMIVKAIKEGKEPGQGVAYLDDGTMVIVDGGLRYLKQNVEVVVTSVLQTTAGRMIFSNVKDGHFLAGRDKETVSS